MFRPKIQSRSTVFRMMVVQVSGSKVFEPGLFDLQLGALYRVRDVKKSIFNGVVLPSSQF